MQVFTDIAYIADGNSKHTLDIYLPSNSAETSSLPLIVYIHGGAWRTGDKSDFTKLCKGLITVSQDKIAVAAVSYRLCTRSSESIKHPELLNDAVNAVKFLISGSYPGKPHVDTNKVFLVGHSAGAHLSTLMVLSEQPGFQEYLSCIKGVLGVSGIYDIPELLKVYPDYSDFVEMAFDKSQYQNASPYYVAQTKYANAEHLRFLIVSSTADELIASVHSARFACQLVSSGYSNVAMVIKDIGTHDEEPFTQDFWRIVNDFILK